MKLHANVGNYQISKFYTQLITRTVHTVSMNTTHRLHAFYVRVGAAIPLTSTVYADDCQLYISFKKKNALITASMMERLVKDIENWMTSNMLKLNGDKSDIMVLNGPHRPRIELPPITICDESVF